MEEGKALLRAAFGPSFAWGVSVAAYQVEGAHDQDGKGPSIWDTFSSKKGKINRNHHGRVACNFYSCYPDDIRLLRELHISNFRFSLSWSRILPQGTGRVNEKGVDYYHRLLDHCLALGIEPWVTLYHWDLPHELETRGGWTNRDILGWFSEYVQVCVERFGDRVGHWMVLNEPMVFTGAGYYLGVHAPGRRWLKNFLPAVHHAALCQAEGSRIIRSLQPGAQVGTTFSCTYIEPRRADSALDVRAARRVDALLNRLFLEPSLGLGYPFEDLPFLRRMEAHFRPGDEKRLLFEFDFIGVQNYTREIITHSYFTPFIDARIVKPQQRGVPTTLMNWEVYPESIYRMLKQYNAYPGVKKLIVTENGAAFADECQDGKVDDPLRVRFLQDYIAQVLRAKQEGVRVDGYFVWTFLDNFEWAEGYHPRFGLVYVDFNSQQRVIKSSGYWYRDFLKGG